MTFTGCETDLLRRLAETPFAGRLDLAALSGWSRGAVYAAMDGLAERGMAQASPHATPLLPPTRRYHLTVDGLSRLVEIEEVSPDELLRWYPISARWRRVLLERLDALAVIYRLAAAISNLAHPVRFRWFRAAPLDAGIVLPDGRTLSVVWQGLTADRTGFAKRLWRLGEGPLPGGVLVLLPDEVRLRQARRMLAGANFPVFLTLERDAALAGPDSPVWRPPSVAVRLDLRYVLSRLDRGGALPEETRPARPARPGDIDLDAPAPDCLLPALLGPAGKRALDLLSDWPWVSKRDLAGLMGVSGRRVSQLVARLEGFGLVSHTAAEGQRLLALTDRGLALLARRDRASVGTARRRWGVAPLAPQAPLTWRNVSGSRSRQLLRNVEYTSAVHWFLAALARQAHARGWEVTQLDPPRRVSRYFRHEGRLHSVRPDAFGVLRRSGEDLPFFLEWERRAVRPVTMAARLAPYLRYFSSHRPLDDHGATPAILVVFDDDLAATHFLRVAREETDRSGVRVPLWVSHKAALERLGPLGRAWFTLGGWDRSTPLQGPGCHPTQADRVGEDAWNSCALRTGAAGPGGHPAVFPASQSKTRGGWSRTTSSGTPKCSATSQVQVRPALIASRPSISRARAKSLASRSNL